jgi:hypothetical protein
VLGAVAGAVDAAPSHPSLAVSSVYYFAYWFAFELISEGFGMMILRPLPARGLLTSTLPLATLYSALAAGLTTVGFNWRHLGIPEAAQMYCDNAFLILPLPLYALTIVAQLRKWAQGQMQKRRQRTQGVAGAATEKTRLLSPSAPSGGSSPGRSRSAAAEKAALTAASFVSSTSATSATSAGGPSPLRPGRGGGGGAWGLPTVRFQVPSSADSPAVAPAAGAPASLAGAPGTQRQRGQRWQYTANGGGGKGDRTSCLRASCPTLSPRSSVLPYVIFSILWRTTGIALLNCGLYGTILGGAVSMARSVLMPLIIYGTLIADTRYWRALANNTLSRLAAVAILQPTSAAGAGMFPGKGGRGKDRGKGAKRSSTAAAESADEESLRRNLLAAGASAMTATGSGSDAADARAAVRSSLFAQQPQILLPYVSGTGSTRALPLPANAARRLGQSSDADATTEGDMPRRLKGAVYTGNWSSAALPGQSHDTAAAAAGTAGVSAIPSLAALNAEASHDGMRALPAPHPHRRKRRKGLHPAPHDAGNAPSPIVTGHEGAVYDSGTESDEESNATSQQGRAAPPLAAFLAAKQLSDGALPPFRAKHHQHAGASSSLASVATLGASVTPSSSAASPTRRGPAALTLEPPSRSRSDKPLTATSLHRSGSPQTAPRTPNLLGLGGGTSDENSTPVSRGGGRSAPITNSSLHHTARTRRGSSQASQQSMDVDLAATSPFASPPVSRVRAKSDMSNALPTIHDDQYNSGMDTYMAPLESRLLSDMSDADAQNAASGRASPQAGVSSPPPRSSGKQFPNPSKLTLVSVTPDGRIQPLVDRGATRDSEDGDSDAFGQISLSIDNDGISGDADENILARDGKGVSNAMSALWSAASESMVDTDGIESPIVFGSGPRPPTGKDGSSRDPKPPFLRKLKNAFSGFFTAIGMGFKGIIGNGIMGKGSFDTPSSNNSGSTRSEYSTRRYSRSSIASASSRDDYSSGYESTRSKGAKASGQGATSDSDEGADALDETLMVETDEGSKYTPIADHYDFKLAQHMNRKGYDARNRQRQQPALQNRRRPDAYGGRYGYDSDNAIVDPDILHVERFRNANLQYLIDFAHLQIGPCIDSGGTAAVHVGTYMTTKVAIKEFVPSRIDDHVIAFFHKENAVNAALSALKHPNIVRYYGLCVSPPHVSLVFEFCDRGSLYNLIDKILDEQWAFANRFGRASVPRHLGYTHSGRRFQTNPAPSYTGPPQFDSRQWIRNGDTARPRKADAFPDLPWRRKLRLMKGGAAALAYLHSFETPFLHRDIKSQNFLVTRDFEMKLSDFGESRTRQRAPMTGKIGTYQWMAPEMMRGAPYSEAVDIYSFGLVLWEIMACQHPFSDIPEHTLAFRVAGEALRPEVCSDWPAALVQLIQQCWQEDPQLRPSAAEVLKVVEKL